MTQWFGQSWGAPICDPEDHCATPVRDPCLHCRELILVGDQGLVMPLVEGAILRMVAMHLDCYLRRVLPHTRECPHCRGKERDEHARQCNYRQGGGNCNCVALEDL